MWHFNIVHVIKSPNLIDWLNWQLSVENRGNGHTWQMPANLIADTWHARYRRFYTPIAAIGEKSQSLHRAHLAIFTDRRDRRIKSPGVSPELATTTATATRTSKNNRQNNNSARALHFLVHFFAVTIQIGSEISWWDVLWRTWTQGDEFFSLFLNLGEVSKNSSPGNFTYILHLKWVRIITTTFEKTRIHCNNDVFAVIFAEAPYCLNARNAHSPNGNAWKKFITLAWIWPSEEGGNGRIAWADWVALETTG